MSWHCEEPRWFFQTLKGRSRIGYQAALLDIVTRSLNMINHGLNALVQGCGYDNGQTWLKWILCCKQCCFAFGLIDVSRKMI